MTTDHKSIPVKHWIQFQLSQVARVVLILFVAYILADILVELVNPNSGSAGVSFKVIFQEMKSFDYWIQKLILSFIGGLLYGAFLWYLKGRKHSTDGQSRKNETHSHPRV